MTTQVQSAGEILTLRHCPECRYDLTGLPRVHACPECGFEFDESMFQIPPRSQGRRPALPTWAGWTIRLAVLLGCVWIFAYCYWQGVETLVLFEALIMTGFLGGGIYASLWFAMQMDKERAKRGEPVRAIRWATATEFIRQRPGSSAMRIKWRRICDMRMKRSGRSLDADNPDWIVTLLPRSRWKRALGAVTRFEMTCSDAQANRIRQRLVMLIGQAGDAVGRM